MIKAHSGHSNGTNGDFPQGISVDLGYNGFKNHIVNQNNDKTVMIQVWKMENQRIA